MGAVIPIVWLFLFFPVFCFAAVDSTNREIVQVYSQYYFGEKNYDRAETLLRRHLTLDGDDSLSWNTLGLVQLEKGNPSSAEESFRHATRTGDRSARGIFLYNLADALVRQGKDKPAKKALNYAKRFPNVEDSVELALNEISSGQPLPPLIVQEESDSQTGLKKYLSLGTGYDSNVILLSDNSLDSVSVSDRASFFLTPSLQMQYGSGLFESQLVSLFTYYTNSSTSSYNSLYNSVEVKYGRVQFVSVDVDVSFLNSNGFDWFNWNAKPSFGMQFGLGNGIFEAELPVYYTKYQATSDSDNDRTGFGTEPTVSFLFPWIGASWDLALSYQLNWSAGKNYRSHGVIVPVSITTPPLSGWLVSVDLEGAFVTYPEISTGRRDILFKAGFGVSKELLANLSAGVDYSFKLSSSSLEAATYQRHLVSVGVTYGF